MTTRTRLIHLPTLVLLAAVCALPQRSVAQAAQRTTVDRPSQNRETRAQHESLAVHFVRTPKAKSGSAGASTGTPDTRAQTPMRRGVPQETPLPVKRRGSGKS